MTLTPTQLGLLVAVIAVGGVIVGGVVAGLFALLTGHLDNRRQHKRWQREKRLSAQLAYLTLIDRHATNAGLKMGPKSKIEEKDALEELNEAVSAMSLLGPEPVLTAARDLRDTTAEYISKEAEPESWPESRSEFILASRKSLGVSHFK
jgi:hypothetical protein